jgi:hypothetical protein
MISALERAFMAVGECLLSSSFDCPASIQFRRPESLRQGVSDVHEQEIERKRKKGKRTDKEALKKKEGRYPKNNRPYNNSEIKNRKNPETMA